MASTLFVVGYMKAASREARDELISEISLIAEYAQKNEPATSKYCVAVPRDDSEDMSIYVIEEYNDKKAFDKHMSEQAVLNVLKILESRPEMLVAPGNIDFSNPIVGVTRSTDAQDPFIIYAALDYKPDTFEEGVKGWKEVVAQTEKTEPQTLAYICLKDRDQENRIRMFEVYENEKVFETHCGTEFVGKKVKDEERLKAKDPNVVFLKRVSGFLSKL